MYRQGDDAEIGVGYDIVNENISDTSGNDNNNNTTTNNNNNIDENDNGENTYSNKNNKYNERGDDTVGHPHRAQISQFDFFELTLLLKVDKRLPVVQFEATVS